MINYVESIVLQRLRTEELKEIIELISKICDGNIYLVGGYLYKTIISDYYNIEFPKCDIDFLIDGTINCDKLLQVFHSWQFNKHGGIKVCHNGRVIDIFELKNYILIKQKNLKPSIQNYLKEVPFSVQSIAFDIKNGILLESGAFADIKNKIITINNQENFNLDKRLQHKAMTKAKELGFTTNL